MGDRDKAVTKSGLPRLVGYREIDEAFGLSRKQLERMQADGRFPRAMHITGVGGNRRAWPLQQVLDWFDSQKTDLARTAATDPSQLKPEQVPDAIESLAKQFAKHNAIEWTDETIVAINTPITGERLERARQEIADRNAEWLDDLVQLLLRRTEQIHFIEATILQRAFLPPLRIYADAILKGFNFNFDGTEDDWQEVGLALVGRMLNGKTFDPKTQPADVVTRLVAEGVIKEANEAEGVEQKTTGARASYAKERM